MLDPRLSLCASLVRGDHICDVGTDHGYLPAALILSGKCRRAIAADINEKPLLSAAATAEKYGLSDRITIIRSDGLKNIDTSEVTDISIAGMGGELISRILDESPEKLSEEKNLILQPMTKADVLRKYLCGSGFEIISERAVRDGKFIYTVIAARKNGKITPCSEADAHMGFMDLSLPDEYEYALGKIKKFGDMGAAVSQSDKETGEYYIRLAEEIKNKLKQYGR